jgi:uncharacterized protein with GYD domain
MPPGLPGGIRFFQGAVSGPGAVYPPPVSGSKLALSAGGRNTLMEVPMAAYVLLARYTEHGIKNIKDTTKRAEEVRELAKKAGVVMKDTYWTLGRYDVVALFDAPDDETMTAFSLSIAKKGNVTTETMRAFTAADVSKILGRMV